MSDRCLANSNAEDPRIGHPHPCRHAFTVPEMLAVVAIITIIISILLPNLGQAKAVAREAICRSNLHQISLASRGYATDTGYMPTGWVSNYVVWIAEIYDYANRDPNLFYCPTAPIEAKWSGIQPGGTLPALHGYRQNELRVLTNEFFSYGHNNGGSNDGHIPMLGVGAHVNTGWVRSNSVVSPSNFIMYGDSTVDGLWDHFIDEDYENGTGQTEYPADRHRGGAHITFGDGHVEFQLQKHLIILGSEGTILPDQRRRWNNDDQPH